MEDMEMGECTTTKLNRGAVAIGLIVLGAMLLLGMGFLWPMFILVPGLVILGAAYSGRKPLAPLAIPGMLVTGTGALLFMQNLTGYWESWSYAWTLYIVFLGMGLALMGRWMDVDNLASIGRHFMNAGLILFAVFAFLMEVIFNVSGGPGMQGWAILFIAIGGFMLWRNSQKKSGFRISNSKRKNHEALFTGPIVYGSHVRSHSSGSRLTVDAEEKPKNDH
jgi:hypothetical protein